MFAQRGEKKSDLIFFTLKLRSKITSHCCDSNCATLCAEKQAKKGGHRDCFWSASLDWSQSSVKSCLTDFAAMKAAALRPFDSILLRQRLPLTIVQYNKLKLKSFPIGYCEFFFFFYHSVMMHVFKSIVTQPPQHTNMRLLLCNERLRVSQIKSSSLESSPGSHLLSYHMFLGRNCRSSCQTH